jgi:hypothetical protein
MTTNVISNVEPDDNGWISIEKGLPPIEVNVLVTAWDGKIFIGHLLHSKDKRFYGSDEYSTNYKSAKAWQHLPYPYREK